MTGWRRSKELEDHFQEQFAVVFYVLKLFCGTEDDDGEKKGGLYGSVSGASVD